MVYGEEEGGVWDVRIVNPLGGVTLRALYEDDVDRNLDGGT